MDFVNYIKEVRTEISVPYESLSIYRKKSKPALELR